MRKAPKFLKKYFWDIDFNRLDIRAHPSYVLGRILEYGDQQAISWMRKNFTESEIKDTLCKFRGYSQKSANFWAFILGIKRENVKCLSKSFREIQKQFWPY